MEENDNDNRGKEKNNWEHLKKKQKLHNDKQLLKLWQVDCIIIMGSHFLHHAGVNNKATLSLSCFDSLLITLNYLNILE